MMTPNLEKFIERYNQIKGNFDFDEAEFSIKGKIRFIHPEDKHTYCPITMVVRFETGKYHTLGCAQDLLKEVGLDHWEAGVVIDAADEEDWSPLTTANTVRSRLIQYL